MYYYKQVKNGQIVSVEAKSVDSVSPNFIGATKVEYDGFLVSLPPQISQTPRDLEAEIDDLKTRLKNLEKKAE